MGLNNITTGAASLLSGGLGFLGNLGGSIAGGIFASREAEKNRKFQEKMYNKQVEDNIKFWNMQNEYNLPSAERQRLEDAGLNPYLMYSQGAGQNVATSAPAPAQAPHGAQASPGSFNTSIDLANLALVNQQKKESESREYLNYKEAENKEADTGLKGLQGEQLKISTSFDKDTYQLRMDILKSDKDLKDSMFYLNYRQANALFKQVDVMTKQIEDYNSQIANREKLTNAQVNKMSQELQQGWKRLSGELALMSAQARNALANAYAARVNADIAKGLYSPEYIKILQGSAGQQFLNAIRTGDAQLLQNGILAKQFGMTPDYDSAPGKIKFWMDNVVSPITGAISDIAVTAGGVGVAAKSLGGMFQGAAPAVTGYPVTATPSPY